MYAIGKMVGRSGFVRGAGAAARAASLALLGVAVLTLTEHAFVSSRAGADYREPAPFLD